MATAIEHERDELRTWRAGGAIVRLHLLSVFSLAVAFVCLAAALLVVTNLAAVRDRWSRAGRATVYLRDGAVGRPRSARLTARAREHGRREEGAPRDQRRRRGARW